MYNRAANKYLLEINESKEHIIRLEENLLKVKQERDSLQLATRPIAQDKYCHHDTSQYGINASSHSIQNHPPSQTTTGPPAYESQDQQSTKTHLDNASAAVPSPMPSNPYNTIQQDSQYSDHLVSDGIAQDQNSAKRWFT